MSSGQEFIFPLGGAVAGYFAGAYMYSQAFAEGSKCGCEKMKNENSDFALVMEVSGAFAGMLLGMFVGNITSETGFDLSPQALISIVELGAIGFAIYFLYNMSKDGGLVAGAVKHGAEDGLSLAQSVSCGAANFLDGIAGDFATCVNTGDGPLGALGQTANSAADAGASLFSDAACGVAKTISSKVDSTGCRQLTKKHEGDTKAWLIGGPVGLAAKAIYDAATD